MQCDGSSRLLETPRIWLNWPVSETFGDYISKFSQFGDYISKFSQFGDYISKFGQISK